MSKASRGPDHHLAHGGAAGFLGFAASATSDGSSALEPLTQAVATPARSLQIVNELSGTVVLGDLWFAAGRPSEARRLCAQALGRAEEHGAQVVQARGRVG